MKILLRVLAACLIVAIPVFSLTAGANLVLRMPDVYQYEFKSTDALRNIPAGMNSDEMGEFISDYMMGKTSDFQVFYGDEAKPSSLFTQEEIDAAARTRVLAGWVLAVCLLALILMLLGIFMLMKNGFGEEIRKRLKRAFMVFGGLVVAYVVVLTCGGKLLNLKLLGFLSYVPLDEDYYSALFCQGLQTKILIMVPVISAIIMGLIVYVLHKVTEPKMIFTRQE